MRGRDGKIKRGQQKKSSCCMWQVTLCPAQLLSLARRTHTRVFSECVCVPIPDGSSVACKKFRAKTNNVPGELKERLPHQRKESTVSLTMFVLLLHLSLLFLQLDLLNYSIISKSIGNIRLCRTCRCSLPSSTSLSPSLILGCFILSSFRPYNQLDTYERASTRHTRSLGKHISFCLPLLPPPPRLHVQWGKSIRHMCLHTY